MNSGPPLWLLILLPVLDFGLPALLFFLGILLFRKTRNSRNSAALYCAKCKYDMRAATSLTCPECGFTHKSPTQLHPHKRFFHLKLTLAAFLCLPSIFVLFICLTYFPAAYLETRRTQATLTHLRALGAQCDPSTDTTLEAPSAWTLQVWSWIYKLPIRPTFYNGYSPSERRNLLFPRLFRADHPISPIAETFLNWTWSPYRNYHWYFPLPQYWYLDFTNGPACTLTQNDARRICDIRFLHTIHLGPQVLVDGPTLAAFASFSQKVEWSELQIQNYQPTPWDNTGWPAAGPIKALSTIDIDARRGVSDSLFAMLASCPNLYALSIRASPQNPSEKILEACLKFDHLRTLSFQGLRITPADLEKLRNFNELENLTLDLPPNSPLTDADFAPLNNLPHLRRITLKNAPRVTGTFLLNIKSELDGVIFSNIPFNDQAFAALAIRSSLSELSFQNTQVTPIAIKELIRKFKHLRIFRYDKPLDMEACRNVAWRNPHTLALSGVDDEQLKCFLSETPYRIELYDHRLSDSIAAQVKAGHFNRPGIDRWFNREVILMNDSPQPTTAP